MQDNRKRDKTTGQAKGDAILVFNDFLMLILTRIAKTVPEQAPILPKTK